MNKINVQARADLPRPEIEKGQILVKADMAGIVIWDGFTWALVDLHTGNQLYSEGKHANFQTRVVDDHWRFPLHNEEIVLHPRGT